MVYLGADSKQVHQEGGDEGQGHGQQVLSDGAIYLLGT